MRIYRYQIVSHWILSGSKSFKQLEEYTFTRWGAEHRAQKLRYEARMQGLIAKRFEVQKR